MTKIALTEKEFKLYYQKLSINQFAKLLGVNRLTIYRTAKQYGLFKQKPHEPKLIITADRTAYQHIEGAIVVTPKQFIGTYYKLTTEKLAKLYGVSRRCIWRKAKQLGLSKRKTKLS